MSALYAVLCMISIQYDVYYKHIMAFSNGLKDAHLKCCVCDTIFVTFMLTYLSFVFYLVSGTHGIAALSEGQG